MTGEAPALDPTHIRIFGLLIADRQAGDGPQSADGGGIRARVDRRLIEQRTPDLYWKNYSNDQ
jgi:hypothetical protein